MSYQASVYGGQPVRLPIFAIVLVAHAVLMVLLARMEFARADGVQSPPLIIDAIEVPEDPPEPPPTITPQPVRPLPPIGIEPPPPPIVAVPPTAAPVLSPGADVTPSSALVRSEPPAPSIRMGTRIVSDSPVYPTLSEKRREEGTVVLRVIVGTSGEVEQISVVESSGFERLDNAALKAVRKWRWTPSERNGVPAMARLTVRIPFVLIKKAAT